MPKAEAQKLKVFQAVARSLKDQGAETMFGLMGQANMFMADSYVRDCGGQFVAAANEAGAAFMALGYSLISGKPGICTVTAGPAVTNTITAVVEGVKGSIPMVLLCGDMGVEDWEHHQKIEQLPFMAAAGAGFERLKSPTTVGADIARAFRRAMLEQRPIALNLPIDFDWSDTNYQAVPRIQLPEFRTVITESRDLDNAVGIIAAAKRPLIVAGRGATSSAARAALLRLAKRIESPIATTLKAKDLFRGEPLDLGLFGTLSSPAAVDIIMESDCIIAVGASLNYRTTSRKTFLHGKRLVQISLDGAEIGKFVQPDVGLVGDAAKTADLLVHWLDEAEIAPSGFGSEELVRKIARSKMTAANETADYGDGTVNYRAALRRLNDALPADRVLVTDAGRFMDAACTILSVPNPGAYINTTNFGSIGMAFSHAIGAAFASAGRPVVVVMGDGGFMHSGLAEFNTAVRYGLDLIIVIANDSAYGSEVDLFKKRQVDPSASFFQWPEFSPLANTLGGKGVVVRSEGDFKVVEQAIRARKGPLLIDLKLNSDRL